MLRKKMLMFLGAIVGLLLLVAVVAILLLQSVLADLDHAAVQDGSLLQTANAMTDTMTRIEIDLREIQRNETRHLDDLVDHLEDLKRLTAAFGEHYARPIPTARPTYEAIQTQLDTFTRHIAMLATVDDDQLMRDHTDQAIAASISLRENILTVARLMREHTASEEHAAIAGFRWVVLGLGIVFVILLNVSLIVLIRMSHVVVKPVEDLVEGSRRLEHEEFDFRVKVRPGDEFSELADAYNHLAERLQLNERRRLETLAQAAVTLNHELNNASAIIKLQLQLLQKQSGDNPAMEKALHQIHESLARMTHTVDALKRVRRIVLTNYSADTQMLDLAESTKD